MLFSNWRATSLGGNGGCVDRSCCICEIWRLITIVFAVSAKIAIQSNSVPIENRNLRDSGIPDVFVVSLIGCFNQSTSFSRSHLAQIVRFIVSALVLGGQSREHSLLVAECSMFFPGISLHPHFYTLGDASGGSPWPADAWPSSHSSGDFWEHKRLRSWFWVKSLLNEVIRRWTIPAQYGAKHCGGKQKRTNAELCPSSPRTFSFR